MGLYLMAIGLLRLGIQWGGGKIEAQKRDQRLMQTRGAKRHSSRSSATSRGAADRAMPKRPFASNQQQPCALQCELTFSGGTNVSI